MDPDVRSVLADVLHTGLRQCGAIGLVYANEAFARIFGYESAGEVLRKSVVVTSAASISLGVRSWNAPGGQTSGNASGCRRVVSDRSRSARKRFRPYRKRIF
jgi:hypothetical protein